MGFRHAFGVAAQRKIAVGEAFCRNLVPDNGPRFEHKLAWNFQSSRPHAKLGFLAAPGKSLLGPADAGIENTNFAEDFATKAHRAKQVADRSNSLRKPRICAPNDPHKFVGKPERPRATPEWLDPPHDAENAGPFANRQQSCKPARVGNGVSIEERNHGAARGRDTRVARP